MSMISFKNQVAIVTGAGQGIGFEIASQLATRGASVVINDVETSLCNEAVSSLTGNGAKATGVAGDASDPEFILTLVEAAVSDFGKLDMAIANAGITLFGEFLSYPYKDFTEVMRVNQGGSFLLAQAAARQMIQQKHGGSILFLSSVTGHQAYKNLAAYGMSKAAIEMLAKHLGAELGQHGINVNAIAPGATLTERTQLDKSYKEKWGGVVPAGRAATTADISNAALFLLSASSRYITGQTLIVDGGWTSVSKIPED